MSTPPRAIRNRLCAAAAASGLVVTWLIGALLGVGCIAALASLSSTILTSATRAVYEKERDPGRALPAAESSLGEHPDAVPRTQRRRSRADSVPCMCARRWPSRAQIAL